MAKYIQLNNGDTIRVPKNSYMNFQCCDCGLVHQVILRNHRNTIDVVMVRDNRRTGQVRRRERERRGSTKRSKK